VIETSVDEAHLIENAQKKHYQSLAIALAGWIVPGAGHLLLGRWGRAILFFCVVGGLAFTGFLLRGQVFPPHSDDPFGTLGFFADACSGVFFILAHLVEKAGPDVSRAAGDYGTRFVAAAGLVNILSVVDAYGIAAGRRP
jgi:TM2 domain-containing membrane protein YozV